MSYIDDIIERKRESICESDGISIYTTFITFKRMYKKAISSKNEKDIKEALDYYKNNKYKFKSMSILEDKANDMARELENILKERNAIKSRESWNNRKKVTVSDIKRKLMIIIRQTNNDPNVIKELERLKAKKFVCHVFEESEDEVIFEVSEDDQEIRIKLSGIIYGIAEDLEKAMYPSISCNTGDGDEGCIYVNY